MSAQGNKLGYKQPPVWSRFAKGQSGNPKGRPKRAHSNDESDSGESKSINDLKHAEFGKVETVIEKGKAVEMSRLALALKAQTASALKGNASAQRHMLQQAETLAIYDDERARLEEEDIPKRLERFYALRERQRRGWDEFVATGTPPHRFFPHPEDIEIDADKGTITWCSRAADTNMAPIVDIRIARDLWLLRYGVELGARSARERYALVCFWSLKSMNGRLPIIWRYTEQDITARLTDQSYMTAKQIAREVDCLELMREILGQAEPSSAATGLAKVDRLLDRAARAQGSADFATLVQPIQAARAKRSGAAMRKEAVERLSRMFIIDVEAERTRRARMREDYEALLVFRKGKPVAA